MLAHERTHLREAITDKTTTGGSRRRAQLAYAARQVSSARWLRAAVLRQVGKVAARGRARPGRWRPAVVAIGGGVQAKCAVAVLVAVPGEEVLAACPGGGTVRVVNSGPSSAT